ncbi:YidH family protein [Nocardioides dongkuii]|uniref:YidH family protein n=1 Tax=Nocardioides dongkuii TaxID=2760089 RepID=UPI0015FDE165|nr:DUF202 domain-containing protein [Nocardioides dongkuii]
MGERRPGWVYGEGEEPDPRFTLANERTFLAWVRTCLGVLAGAIALDTLQTPARDDVRLVLVVSLLLVAAAMAVLAWVRWARVERAIRSGAPLPPFTLGVVVTAALVLVALALVLTVVL